ncbi:iron ABC transporter permease [Cytobacillus horneckiae]|uniref:FecCD family ABC transporter permease n=1 Tax=Cytobacillus horneckiae TaxID=549687 RepID=UPI00399F8E84
MKKYKSFRLFNEKISFLLYPRAGMILAIMAMVTLSIIVISTGVGEMYIAPLQVLQVFFGQGSDLDKLVITDLRLPRILTALFVGMSLAVAGAILQGMIRNPLASPDILGLTGGASVAVVTFLTIFSDENYSLTVSINWMPVAAFAGAAAVAFIVYVLSWKKGVSTIRLVLIGIGITALMKALTTFMILVGPIYRASQVNLWITGSVSAATWQNVFILAPWSIIFILFAFTYSRNINVQGLGEEVAVGLGSNVQKQRVIMLAISTALVGCAVAFAGGIGFVGLMAPHMARRLVGSNFGALLPVSALIGAILVLVSDLIGRTLFSPLEIPAGVFTASIGAPYFIYLLLKAKN